MREKLLKVIEKIMPADRFLITVFSFVFNCVLYYLARKIAGGWPHHILTSRMDDQIPFVPETLSIYFGCYLFWALNYVIIAKREKEMAYQFYFADVLSRVVCFAIFLLFPTTNIRPELNGTGIWYQGMEWLYQIDAADNLFPSIHCLVSWFCYIGIRGSKEIPKWYQRLSCIVAILVFISTLTTKQHVIVDVVSGIILAEFMLKFAQNTKGYLWYMRIWECIAERLFGTRRKLHEKREKEYS